MGRDNKKRRFISGMNRRFCFGKRKDYTGNVLEPIRKVSMERAA